MSQTQRRGRRAGHLRVLHLSDLYLGAEGRPGSADTLTSLDQLLHDLQYLSDVDLVVVSGDVTVDGSTSAYATARRRLGRFAEDRGVPHVYAMGDHDHRGSFADVLGTGHLSSDGLDIGEPGVSGEERAAVSTVEGVRVITLDSTVPDAFHGSLSHGQLTWLRDLLADPADEGSLVVLHHPPLFLDHHPQQPVSALSNAQALAEALAGSDVRAILCGHFMTQLSGVVEGIPVWVTPGVAHRIDLTAPEHLERTVRGGGATVVDLGGPFSPRFHLLVGRDPRAGEQVALVDGVSGRPVALESARVAGPLATTPASDWSDVEQVTASGRTDQTVADPDEEAATVPEPSWPAPLPVALPPRPDRRTGPLSEEALGDPATAPTLERLEASGWVLPDWAREAWARWDSDDEPPGTDQAENGDEDEHSTADPEATTPQGSEDDRGRP